MKIRTDFVTNSSSSSFMLVVRIGLKNGKTLKFKGESGVGEYETPYERVEVGKSPKELSQCADIDELVRLLSASILQDGKYDEDTHACDRVPVLTPSSTFMKQVSRLKSMDEISTITINGDEWCDDQHQYWHYTYYRDQKVLAYDEGGRITALEGTGGRILFQAAPGSVKNLDFGKAEATDKNGYYDADVLLTEAQFKAHENEVQSSPVQKPVRRYREFPDAKSAIAAAEKREQRCRSYRPDMEQACKEGKTLQEMIDRAAKIVEEDSALDIDAFELTLQYLDRDCEVTFEGKHFVLSGIGMMNSIDQWRNRWDNEVWDEIDSRGGIMHEDMVKKADYLVVCLTSPAGAKIRKALEWRQKGSKCRIISDYQLWMAITSSVAE